MPRKAANRDTFYYDFENEYRGSSQLLEERMSVYDDILDILPRISSGRLLDIGCGRGEWMKHAAAKGLKVAGIDSDAEMAAVCAKQGMAVTTGDAFEVIPTIQDESFAAVTAFHVVEHFAVSRLRSLIQDFLRVLEPGGILILETPNPESLYVSSSSFYLDPTHVRPVPIGLLSFVVKHCGFDRSTTLRLQESSEDLAAGKIGIANLIFSTSKDYAIVAQKKGKGESFSAFDEVFRKKGGMPLVDAAQAYDGRISGEIRRLDARAQSLDTSLSKLDERVKESRGEIGQVWKDGTEIRKSLEAVSRSLAKQEGDIRHQVHGARDEAIAEARRLIAEAGAIHMKMTQEVADRIGAQALAMGEVVAKSAVEGTAKAAAEAASAGAEASKLALESSREAAEATRLAVEAKAAMDSAAKASAEATRAADEAIRLAAESNDVVAGLSRELQTLGSAVALHERELEDGKTRESEAARANRVLRKRLEAANESRRRLESEVAASEAWLKREKDKTAGKAFELARLRLELEDVRFQLSKEATGRKSLETAYDETKQALSELGLALERERASSEQWRGEALESMRRQDAALAEKEGQLAGLRDELKAASTALADREDQISQLQRALIKAIKDSRKMHDERYKKALYLRSEMISLGRLA